MAASRARHLLSVPSAAWVNSPRITRTKVAWGTRIRLAAAMCVSLAFLRIAEISDVILAFRSIALGFGNTRSAYTLR